MSNGSSCAWSASWCGMGLLAPILRRRRCGYVRPAAKPATAAAPSEVRSYSRCVPHVEHCRQSFLPRAVRRGWASPRRRCACRAAQTFLGRIATELVGGGAAPGDSRGLRRDAAGGLHRPRRGSTRRIQYVDQPGPRPRPALVAAVRPRVVPDAPAVLVTLVDVPLVTAALVRRAHRGVGVVPARRSSGPTRAGRHGHPMLVAQPLIGELLAADPSSSARDHRPASRRRGRGARDCRRTGRFSMWTRRRSTAG